MKPITMQAMIDDGCSYKFASYYMHLLQKESESDLYDRQYMKWAHSKGFLAESAYAYGLDEKNLNLYLSDYDYYKCWPLNNWMRIWINDKLTLKYILAGTEYDSVMPNYYFYTLGDKLYNISDHSKNAGVTISDFLEVLKSEGQFACKPANGTASEGFFKISYYKGKYSIGNKECKVDDIVNFVKEHSNYIFTEFLTPHSSVAGLSANNIHTIRIVVLNENGISPKIVGGYFRLATKAHGSTNHINNSGDGNSQYDLLANLDLDTGKFNGATKVYCNKVIHTDVHPDTNEPIYGTIGAWENIKRTLLGISKMLSGIEWMGFDACIDKNGSLKLMEINSHPGIKYMQLFEPFYNSSLLKNYFSKKLLDIDSLALNEKEKRTKIPR